MSEQSVVALSIMKNLFTNWNFMRIVRLALGVSIIIQGVLIKEWMFVGLGALFSLMPILNIGCCATDNCGVPNRKNISKEEEVIFEEVK